MSSPNATPMQPPPSNAAPAKPAPTEIPQGTKENRYQGLGNWSFNSDDEAYKFFEEMLPESERPPGWKAKIVHGCVGLNSLRCGDPSGQVIPKTSQNSLTRPDAEIFKGEQGARDRLTALQEKNPGKTYYLAAAQIPATPAGRRKFDRLADGPLKLHDLNGVIDHRRPTEYNFATSFPAENGKSYWEWMNHGLDVEDDERPAVRHSESLPETEKPTLFLIVEKKAWDK